MATLVPDKLRQATASALQALTDHGWQPAQIALALEWVATERDRQIEIRDEVQLVWSGPITESGAGRDTGIVVRELFASVRRSILIAGFAIQRGKEIFAPLAACLDRDENLSVRLLLNVHRPPSGPEDPQRYAQQFARRFLHDQWPGQRAPLLFYDPRSLADDTAERAVLHAKCIIVDEATALVTSANFTEAAQQRNIEVGVLIRNRLFARNLTTRFEELITRAVIKPIL